MMVPETGRIAFLGSISVSWKKLYDRFFTERGTKLAVKRRAAAEAFYGSLLMEAEGTYRMGKERLSEVLRNVLCSVQKNKRYHGINGNPI